MAAIRTLHIATRCRDHIVSDFVLGAAIRADQPHRLVPSAHKGAELTIIVVHYLTIIRLYANKIRPSGADRFAGVIETRHEVGQKGGKSAKECRVIELDKVAYSYGGAELFADLSLTLAPGTFHFLTGPSGAGKTTLLKLCYGELIATAGQVRLFGDDTRGMPRDQIALARRRIGVVHQDCQFLDHLPVADNIALPLSVAGRLDEAESNIDDLLSWVGLSGQAAQLPPQLSGGERQRAALARAVIMSPDVVIADEPTGNIDWEMSQRLLSLLVELNKMGKAVLVATHDMNLIRAAKAQVSARVLRLKGRKLQAAGADL
jgi:cell division transport system ATP-binding protein